ncbi:MAG: hypothetical protein HY553_00655 [Elusimicrobia bacterium]|nr:hypothetical protein [Elusimicrobiota bacterium]
MIGPALLALAASAALASHDDFGFGARASGLGEAATAVGDEPGSAAYNPALISAIENPVLQAGLRRAFQSPAGKADYHQTEYGGAARLKALPWRGALALHSRSASLKGGSTDRTHGVTYATHGWRETDDGVVDWGVTLNALTRTWGGTLVKGGIDLGVLYRIRERFHLAASLLNVNGPRTDLNGVADRAPVTARIGFAQVARGFTMAVDGVRREPVPGRRATSSFSAGMERWTYTGRIGAVALRTGLNLGGPSRSWALGFGWRALGAQLDYAALAPLSSGSAWGHAVSLVFRFGSWDPDKEFERLLGSEIRYRKELAHALDTAEVKQWKLAEELRRLRRSLEDLQAELNTRVAGEAEAQQKYREARDKIRELQEREQEAQRALDQLDKDRKAVVEQSKEANFREDWRAYQKLKLQSVPDLVLLERVKQILRQYKESGVDLSEANQELKRLLLNLQPPP